jgi:SAM-dependent methyltransferase
MYTDLAAWFHLLTAPEEYAEEAGIFIGAIKENAQIPVQRVLELGSGGGNNASHMKSAFHLTLVDLSPSMLELSRSLNPECEHLHGDMRSFRVERQWDAVFIHDAISYIFNLEELEKTIRTAFIHCRPGGVALFAPDWIRENFQPGTEHGGHDGPDGRSLRYLEWTVDPDPNDHSYQSDFVYLLRNGTQPPRLVNETHTLGLFSREDWMCLIASEGFSPLCLPFKQPELTGIGSVYFMGIKNQSGK